MTLRQPGTFGILSRHFFRSLFNGGFLSEAGEVGFVRGLIGIGAVFLACGLLLARIFMTKYGDLAATMSPAAYQRSIVADHAFLIAVQMWVVACVATFVSNEVLSDETDLRVLTPLPVARRVVFRAKLTAVGAFTGLFVVGTQVALTPLFLLTVMSRLNAHSLAQATLAYAGASLVGSFFAVAGIIGVQALPLLCVSREYALSVSGTIKGGLVSGLVLAIPLVLELPALADTFEHGPAWLVAVPPAWFIGLQLWFLGDRRELYVHLATAAAWATSLATIIMVGTQALLSRQSEPLARSRRNGNVRKNSEVVQPSVKKGASGSAGAAIWTFTWITLRRSHLHWSVSLALSSAAVGLVTNGLLGAGLSSWMTHQARPPLELIHAVWWAPFAAMYTLGVAIVVTLRLPVESRANWIFRMTEDGATRPAELTVAVQVIQIVAVVGACLLLLPVQVLVLGQAATSRVSIAAILCGFLYIELLMRDWAQLPFTRAYIPGKTFVPFTVIKTAGFFLLFCGVGVVITEMTLASGALAIGLDAVILSLVLVLRRWRLQAWRDTPLEFDDVLPTEINPLILTSH
jgi:hypothetical protein